MNKICLLPVENPVHQIIGMADIKNKIYEAGLFRPDERVVLATANCVLLEHFTGKTYSYRMVELATLKAKHLFSRQKPLTGGNYQKAIEKMLAQAVAISDDEEQTVSAPQTGSNNRAEILLTTIFTDILPRHGMTFRENQLALAMDMLAALQESKLALCEAEVGTGKTHAYILAVAVHKLFTGDERPAMISTSTIALQKALTEYVKKRICVERCHRGCEFAGFCRYRTFSKSCLTVHYDFQIANHNLVLADVLSEKGGRKRLFPDCGVIIFDEAHKLFDTAQQMYGIAFEDTELEQLAAHLYRAIGTQNTDRGEIVRLCEDLLRQNGLLFDSVKKRRGKGYENSSTTIHFDFNCISTLKALTLILQRLSVLFFTLDRSKRRLYAELVNRREGTLAKLTILFDHTQSICQVICRFPM